MANNEQLDDMVHGYIECALWAGQDWSAVDKDPGAETNPVPWDENYDADDLSDAAVAHIKSECRDFLTYVEENVGDTALDRWVEWGATWEGIGHDFYLTRNSHGTGFWDRWSDGGERELIGDKLSDAAHTWGHSDFYVGDDGKLEVE